MIGRAVIKLLFCIGALALGAAGAPAAERHGKDLVTALQGGGYVIYFRHAATDWSQPDRIEDRGDWTSCDPTEIRQLSDEGRQAARDIGAAMRSLDVPVSAVLASPYCRAAETAKLMDLGPVKTTTAIINMDAARFFGGREAVAGRAKERLAATPKEGANTVLVAHGNVIRAAAGIGLGEGGAAVFAPQDGDDFNLVAQLAAEEWMALADQYGRDE